MADQTFILPEPLRAAAEALAENLLAAEQKAAIAYLREVNLEINQLLGMDFAALASRSCC